MPTSQPEGQDAAKPNASPTPAETSKGRAPDGISKLLRLAGPLQKAFASTEDASCWLQTPSPALDGKTPTQLILAGGDIGQLEAMLSGTNQVQGAEG